MGDKDSITSVSLSQHDPRFMLINVSRYIMYMCTYMYMYVCVHVCVCACVCVCVPGYSI